MTGQEGNFQVTVRKHPRYVDENRCVGCGLCAAKCPAKTPSEFNLGMDQRKAVFVPFAQTVPLKYTIDREACLYFRATDRGKKGKCRACVKFCKKDAIGFDQKETIIRLNVGAIILAPGFQPFDPAGMAAYQYSEFENVVTSMDFERILAATGPTKGRLRRPSDDGTPEKIAWLQCVGSRDVNRCDHAYCSSVCCMYAIKQATVAAEHSSGILETAVFFMDMRTHGKEFEKYYQRAKMETGTRFIRCRIHSVQQREDMGVTLRYVDDEGAIINEDFDMIVLSVGIEPPGDAIRIADTLGIDLDDDRFIKTSSFNPVGTSRPGVYVAGCFQGPKDIPQSVMEGSAAAASAALKLASASGTSEQTPRFAEERNIANEPIRTGVFICNCGVNIASVVDIKQVANFSKTLPHVVYVHENLFSCSQDAQEQLVTVITQERLNRIVVAACSPRTHEPIFQETLVRAGLNKHLFEMANIRDQDSWVHSADPEAATKKAKDLVAMAVAKANLRIGLETIEVPLVKSGLVLGGGVSGITAALTLAEQGFKVYLIERSDRLGGQSRHITKTFSGEPVPPMLDTIRRRVEAHERIDVHLGAEPKRITGFVGNFRTYLTTGVELSHGTIIVATGGSPVQVDEYLYGQDERIMTWFDLDKKIRNDPKAIKNAKCAVAIHCVGSREPHRPYCSKICCTHAVQNAIELKKLNPGMNVFMLYRDLRTYGRFETLYQQARSMGVVFIRYDRAHKPEVERETDKLKVTVLDHVLKQPISLHPDFITLYTAISPEGSASLAPMLKVPTSAEGFFQEAHMKLRPVDFSTDGIYMCGLAHYPKPIEECITQAQAAASRAVTVLAQDNVRIEPIVATAVDEDACRGCGLCADLCPYGALEIRETQGKRKVTVTPALCKGCGVCAASCYRHALTVNAFTNSQIGAQVHACFDG